MGRALVFACLITTSVRGGAPAENVGGRAHRIVERLASIGEGRAIVARLGAERIERSIQLRQGPSHLEGPSTFRLDASRTDEALAARLGHLAMHVVDPLPAMPSDGGGPRGDESCRRWVEGVVRLETGAHAAEERLVVALGATATREPLESVDDLAIAYRDRCVAKR